MTGASKGLGATFAEELASRGADLVLIARSRDALQTLAARLTAQYGVTCYVIAADLADPRSIDDIFSELAEQGVQIDLLINNAGLGLSGHFLDHDLAKEQASIQVNVQALVGLSHRFGKAMATRGRGGIINIASNSASSRCRTWRHTPRRKLSSCISAKRCNMSCPPKGFGS